MFSQFSLADAADLLFKTRFYLYRSGIKSLEKEMKT